MTIPEKLTALAEKAIWAAAAGNMTELTPDDVRLLKEAAKALTHEQRQEAVDREVRAGRAFYGRHNPPNTMLATIFNDILRANGTFEADLAANQKREALASPQGAEQRQEDLMAKCYASLAKAVAAAGFDINSTNGEMYLTPKPSPPGVQAAQVSVGVALIAAERQRQVSVERWTPEHDAKHSDGVLARAGAAYAIGRAYVGGEPVFPFDEEWWKPSPGNRTRELVKAGALIAAEIDRLQRLARPGSAAHGGEEMVLVPRDATHAMMDAGVKAARNAPLDSEGNPGYRVCRDAWDAMIASQQAVKP